MFVRNICLKFFCDAKLITPLFIFLMFLFEMKTAFLYQYILKLYTFEYGYLVWLHIKEGKRQRRERVADEQPLSYKPPLMQCEET